MTATDNQRQQVIQLLQTKASERATVEQTGLSRRQIRKIKQEAQKTDDDNPVAFEHQATMTRADAITELVKLSTRAGGVRRSEMWPILREFYGLRLDSERGSWVLNMTENQYQYLKNQFKEAAASQGKEALIIPEWLPRQAPVAANDMLAILAGQLHDRAEEYAAYFAQLFPETSWKKVIGELIYVAFPQASKEPVEVRCKRNANVAEQLQGRLGHLAQRPAANDAPAFKPDAELDRLCI
ncbi:hypothetical protein [Pseudomonas sp. KB-10]|uniref:hypothetical protein n=1 Tax=Pseudomonas sp. KB-10 TaxID=2292264 RepID=UPI001BAF622B|nr:hypothetical protein [Pseudomonas sp. KB-10]